MKDRSRQDARVKGNFRSEFWRNKSSLNIIIGKDLSWTALVFLMTAISRRRRSARVAVCAARQSPQVYETGWMCLQDGCIAFWKVNGKGAPEKTGFNRAFDVQTRQDQIFSASRASMRGIVCPRCNRCAARRYWNSWRCETEACGFIQQILRTPFSAVCQFQFQLNLKIGHSQRLKRSGAA